MNPRTRLWLVAFGLAGVAALLVAACLDLPHFGGDRHPYGDRAVHASLDRHTANTIASVNFDQRAFDTLGETTILFAAVVGCVVLLRQTRDEHRARPAPAAVAPPVRRYALLVLPVALLIGLYVIAHGQLSPGGGFQGGVVAATSCTCSTSAPTTAPWNGSARSACSRSATPCRPRPTWSPASRASSAGRLSWPTPCCRTARSTPCPRAAPCHC